MKRVRLSIMAAIVMAGGGGAHASDAERYIDDRSDGAALVRSLYNAINRKEFARAYSYFDEGKAQGDYRAFVEGYADTVDVKVITGLVKAEGAAGSVYEPVPVAVRSVRKNGKETIFSGCYVTRIVSAGIQEPPFTPLHIESAELKEAPGPLEKALPKTCRAPS